MDISLAYPMSCRECQKHSLIKEIITDAIFSLMVTTTIFGAFNQLVKAIIFFLMFL